MQKSIEWKETFLIAFVLLVGLASYGIPLRGLVSDEDLLSGAVRNLTISYWKSTAAITAQQGAANGLLLRTVKSDGGASQSDKTTEVDLPAETTGNVRAISEHNPLEQGSLNLTSVTSPRSGDRSCGINRQPIERK